MEITKSGVTLKFDAQETRMIKDMALITEDAVNKAIKGDEYHRDILSIYGLDNYSYANDMAGLCRKLQEDL